MSDEAPPPTQESATAYPLGGHAEALWDPIIALMASLVRISNEPLTPGQRTLVGGMMADAEGMARRAEVLVLSTPTSPPPPAVLPEVADVPAAAVRATVLVVDDDP